MFSIRIKSKIKVGKVQLQQFIRHLTVDNHSHAAKPTKVKQPKLENDNKYFSNLKRLSTTAGWRKAVEILKKDNIHCNRSTLPLFNNLAVNAFWDADAQLGWELLDSINARNYQPNCETFQAYWNYCTLDRNAFYDNVEKMLEFMSKNELIVSTTVIEELSNKISRFGGLAVPVNVSQDGVCEKCQHQMQQLQQSALDFHSMKREFEKVLVKPNITTVELSVLRQMVNKKRTFDYVVDALNVTRIFPDSTGNLYKQGQLLVQLIKQLKAHNKKVFVVGKKHMEEWPQDSVNFVRKNAAVYLSQNKVAVDDILMMYATIISGPTAHFVTNDLLPEYPNEFSESGRELFRNWQKQHQHFVAYDEQTDKIHIRRPNRFVCNAAKVPETGLWHIPFTDKPLMQSLKGLVRIPIKWACIQFRFDVR